MFAKAQELSFPQNNASIKPIEKIAILVAMQEEARPMIQAMNLERRTFFRPELNLHTYSGKIANRDVQLIVNGTDPTHQVSQVGTDAATIAALSVVTEMQPDLLISAGTAGGYASRGAQIGDIYVSRGDFIFHDRHIPINTQYQNYSKGRFSCLEAPNMIKHLNLKSGIISTGNSLTINSCEQDIINQHNVVAKEMEVAAIAAIAQRFNTPVMATKAITNLVGMEKNAAAEFESHFTLATRKLAKKLPEILNYLLGKTPQQLKTSLSLVKPAHKTLC